MILSHTLIWRKLREFKILQEHRRVAEICEAHIADYQKNPVHFELAPRQHFDSDRIIWQYWAQGYDDVPPIVKECLESVEKYAGDFTLVRLTDENLQDYLDLPDFVCQKRQSVYSRAFFSDLLRLMLLKTYGGIWMDATIMLSGPIPEEYMDNDLFFFRRDPDEPHIAYWRNTYAYYFGWAKGFRVNMLSSFMVGKKSSQSISELCDLMLLWWKNHDDLPNYFFLQILVDVYGCLEAFPLISYTLPHYLQQSIDNPAFKLMPQDQILKTIPIHKRTYK